jgi:hypothetical protein
MKFCLLMHLLDILFFLEGIERENTPPEKSAKHFFFFLKLQVDTKILTI